MCLAEDERWSCLDEEDGLENTRGEMGWLEESMVDLKLLKDRCFIEVGVCQLWYQKDHLEVAKRKKKNTHTPDGTRTHNL